MESRAESRSSRSAGRRWDGGEFGEFVRRYQPLLAFRVRKALAKAGERPQAEQVEEILQEVYCRLLAGGGRRLAQCRGQSDEEVSAYVGRVAERVAVDSLRTDRAGKRGGDHPTAYAQAALRGAAELAVDPGASPERLLLLEESRRLLLARCAAVVSERYRRRDACILRLLLDGWTSREISVAAGGLLAPTAIDCLLHRVRRRLAADGLAMPPRRRCTVSRGRVGGVSSAP